VAVMDRGRVVQVDTPVALFRSPRTSYVANFIDAGTVVRGKSERSGDVIFVAGPGFGVRGKAPGWLNGTRSVAAVLPPDKVRLVDTGGSQDGVTGAVQRVVFTGSLFEVDVRVQPDLEIRSALTVAEAGRLGDALSPGARVNVSWTPEDVMFVEDVHESAEDLDLEPA
jgi:ABC-type Fe3+/spermidine/putrescine transport system ATPase subunit